MFVGRKNELNKLDSMWNSGRFEFAVIYGRRRVGKTTLINEFIKDKSAIYFTGLETTARDNLFNFSQSIQADKYEYGTAPAFRDFKSAFDAVCKMSENRRLVLVIDEYPYLAASFRAISSILQVQIDTSFKNADLMLILCGSSMSFMENQVLGYKSPLYGRRTAQIKVEPFDFFESCEYLPGYKPEEMVTVYGITGGIPQYLEFMDPGLSVDENIRRNFLDPGGYMFEEPVNLLNQELREPAQYNSVIKAIAEGSTKSSELTSKLEMESGALAMYVRNLISIGILTKDKPITESAGRKTVYAIADSMFRFWYRFIPVNASLIQNRMTEKAYSNISAHLRDFEAKVFEEICRQWLWKQNAAGNLPVSFSRLGRWWGNDPAMKYEAEIDILALDDKSGAIFCECKWTSKQVGPDILETLIARSRIFKFKNCHYYIFSKSGFTETLKAEADRSGKVKLIAFADMLGSGDA